MLPNLITRTDASDTTAFPQYTHLIECYQEMYAHHIEFLAVFSIGALVSSINAPDNTRTPTFERQAKRETNKKKQTAMTSAVCAHTHIHLFKNIKHYYEHFIMTALASG